MQREPTPTAILRASSTPVIDAGVRLGSAPAGPWPFVAASSPYLPDQANQFAEQIISNLSPPLTRIPCSTCNRPGRPDPVQPAGIPPSSQEKEYLADYLALSTVTHCLDGWRYLSLAADAVTRGARNEVIHLAYYAELRAVFSILAGDGISIMKHDEHYALDASGDIIPFKKMSTHVLAWEAFNEWAKLPNQGARLLPIFSSFGVTGLDWLDAMRGGQNAGTIANHWLGDWAVDLRNWSGDQELRNEVSYRPNLSASAFEPLEAAELDLLTSCLRASLRSEFREFEALDIAVTRKLAEAVAVANHLHGSTNQVIAMGVRELARQNGWSRDDSVARFRAVRESKNGAAFNILNLAGETNLGPTGVFSRAFLLMRIASGLLKEYWKQVAPLNGSSHDWIKATFDSYGKHCGLWDATKPTPSWDHLVSDFELHLEDHDLWLQNNRPFNPFSFVRSLPEAIYHLCRLERLPLLACRP